MPELLGGMELPYPPIEIGRRTFTLSQGLCTRYLLLGMLSHQKLVELTSSIHSSL